MNIYKHEIKSHIKSFIFWSIGIIFMIVAVMNKYQAGSGSGSLTEIMDKMPPIFKNMFGMGVFDVGVALDYYGMCFIYVALLVGIHAIVIGASIIAKEEREKTVEYLMTKPVTRARIITSKLLAAFTFVVLINVVTTGFGIVFVGKYTDMSSTAGELLKLGYAMLGIQLFFLFTGSLLSAIMKNPTKSTSLASGILLFMFFLTIIIEMTGKMDFLNVLTPFEYFDSKDIMKGSISYFYLVLDFIVSVAALCGTYIFYKRRDLRA